MKKDVWIVVSNSACARIFKAESAQSLVEVDTLLHPASRLHSKDLGSDRPGRQFESSPQNGARHSMEPKTTPQDVEINEFAKQLADHLNSAAAKDKVRKIYLAANPAFLGLLRKNFSGLTSQVIVEEINKDITHLKPSEILGHFMVTL